jgi:hypothetical protein
MMFVLIGLTIVLPLAVMLYLALRLLFRPGQEMRFMLGLLLLSTIGLSYLCYSLLSINVDHPKAIAGVVIELVRQGTQVKVDDAHALADKLSAFDMNCKVSPKAEQRDERIYCRQQALVPVPGFDGFLLSLDVRDKRLVRISGGHPPRYTLVVD